MLGSFQTWRPEERGAVPCGLEWSQSLIRLAVVCFAR